MQHVGLFFSSEKNHVSFIIFQWFPLHEQLFWGIQRIICDVKLFIGVVLYQEIEVT